MEDGTNVDMKLVDAGPSERGWHQFEQANRCMRWWAFNHVPPTIAFPMSAPLVRGSLFHLGLAHHYISAKTDTSGYNYYEPSDAIAVYANEQAKSTGSTSEANLWLEHIEPVQKAVAAYQLYYSSCDWKTLEVERELRAYIPRLEPDTEPFLYTQRADLIAEDSGGGVWIVDHKTCYRIDSKTLRQHILSGQFLGYHVLGRQKYGRRFRGVIINSSSHPRLRCQPQRNRRENPKIQPPQRPDGVSARVQ